MLPNFLVIGAQKAGTTSLWADLSEHPDCFLPEMKEAHYFAHRFNYRRGRAWYEALFDGADGMTAVGEISPSYTSHPFVPEAPRLAAELLPDVKIIYLIRHPVDRMVSGWAHRTEIGMEHRTLTESLLHETHYHHISSYGMQLARWRARYASEQVLVIRTEDYNERFEETFDRVLAHLGLATGWRPDAPSHTNRTEGKRIPYLKARRLAGALRSAGFARAGRHVVNTPRLRRMLSEEELVLPQGLRDDLCETFTADLALLRSFVGGDLDLWGIA